MYLEKMYFVIVSELPGGRALRYPGAAPGPRGEKQKLHGEWSDRGDLGMSISREVLVRN